jgi:hypothetical protein
MMSILKRIEAAGATVSYNAPLLLPKDIIKQYSIVQIGDLATKFLDWRSQRRNKHRTFYLK